VYRKNYGQKSFITLAPGGRRPGRRRRADGGRRRRSRGERSTWRTRGTGSRRWEGRWRCSL